MRLLFLVLLLAVPAAAAQGVPPTLAALTDSLAAVAAIPDASARAEAVDAVWADLLAAGQVPFRAPDGAAFLFRGPADSVHVAGDHTGWRPAPMTRLAGTDLWLRAEAFPDDARLDYQLIRDGTWLLDPNNPHTQTSGFGPNSELRMPAWRAAPETEPDASTPRGTLGPERTLDSAALGHAVVYRVWTPAGYDARTPLPTVYVTDGPEYANAAMGALPVVMDRLVAERRIEPAVVVFIDPHVDGENRRAVLYLQNDAFVAFVADELVAAIDAAYATRTEADARVILGTSFGGVFATALGLARPDVFGRLAIQSPAYWVTESAEWSGPTLFELAAAAEPGAITAYLHAGTFNDGAEGARRMRDVLRAGDHALTYAERNQGHSWGHWRAELPALLETLLPSEAGR